MLLQKLLLLLQTLVSVFSTWQTSHPLRFSSKIVITVKFSPCLLSTQPRPGKVSPSLLLWLCSQGPFSSPLHVSLVISPTHIPSLTTYVLLLMKWEPPRGAEDWGKPHAWFGGGGAGRDWKNELNIDLFSSVAPGQLAFQDCFCQFSNHVPGVHSFHFLVSLSLPLKCTK